LLGVFCPGLDKGLKERNGATEGHQKSKKNEELIRKHCLEGKIERTKVI